MRDLINQGIWAVPGLLLLIVAWVGFNRPPTNRSGTTFLLFHLGVAFYYALLIAIWLFVIVLLQSGSSGIEYVSRLVGDRRECSRSDRRLCPGGRGSDSGSRNSGQPVARNG